MAHNKKNHKIKILKQVQLKDMKNINNKSRKLYLFIKWYMGCYINMLSITSLRASSDFVFFMPSAWGRTVKMQFGYLKNKEFLEEMFYVRYRKPLLFSTIQVYL